uniref:Uncharacterized protein n=1 Tax=Strongyloides stercoralis TaxID=6248 RepID=A0AAF5CRS4_STRER
MISNTKGDKFIESDYHDGDVNPPHVSWVPILSRRNDKIKEAFDVIVESKKIKNDYINKINRIAEMLNMSYEIENKNFFDFERDNLKNIKNYKMKFIKKSEEESSKNNVFSKNNKI